MALGDKDTSKKERVERHDLGHLPKRKITSVPVYDHSND